MRAQGTHRKPSQTVHKALRLPSTYYIGLQVEGWIKVGTNADHWTIRRMQSPTGGTVMVWAVSQNWGDWQEVNGVRFNELADQLIGRKS